MAGEKIYAFLESHNRNRHLNTATFIMFIFLAVEKVVSGATMRYESGRTFFDFTFSMTDVLQLLIYISMVVLISQKVRHKYLLIPDFVLLCIKLYAAVSGIITLSQLHHSNILKELSVLETTVESLMFALFLLCLFGGKLIHNKHIASFFPVMCLAILSFCVPVTVVFEVLKLYVEEQMNYPLHMEIFIFLRGVINETFLDLPYALLILLVFYCHNTSGVSE